MSYSLSFSKALMVVIYIADKIRQKQFDFLSTAMIAEVINIPRPTLVKIMQGLTHAGIIETKEGKAGGVRLLMKPSELTLLHILDAIEGKPLFHTSFNLMAEGKRPDNAQKILGKALKDAEQQLKSSLSQKTIEQVLIEMGK